MIIIFSPANTTTGGAEMMHQIADALNEFDIPNRIFYYNYTGNDISRNFFQKFYKFKSYNSLVFLNKYENIKIVVPETATYFFNKLNLKGYIVWASIDNYFGFKDFNSNFKNIVNYIKSIFGYNKVSILNANKFQNLSQSFYSTNYLKKWGIRSNYIGDYLNKDFLKNINYDLKKKKNIVLYNPKKGLKYTKKLKNKFNNIEFIPLEKLSKKEMIDLFQKAKVYIDFGLHPGKDRIPREAALYGCCLITSKFGSANNEFDIPIPPMYKFNLNNNFNNFDNIKNLVQNIFNNYELYNKDFDSYRNIILNNEKEFKLSIKKIFK